MILLLLHFRGRLSLFLSLSFYHELSFFCEPAGKAVLVFLMLGMGVSGAEDVEFASSGDGGSGIEIVDIVHYHRHRRPCDRLASR